MTKERKRSGPVTQTSSPLINILLTFKGKGLVYMPEDEKETVGPAIAPKTGATVQPPRLPKPAPPKQPPTPLIPAVLASQSPQAVKRPLLTPPKAPKSTYAGHR